MQHSKVVCDLMADFNSASVLYCHWKSIDHLEASYHGNTDLDILADKKDFLKILEVCSKAGFIMMDTSIFRRYPGVIDFVFFDTDIGKWIHLHLHFQLMCGDRWVKSYRIPIEQSILDNRIFYDKYNTYVVHPFDELCLCYIRMTMKWTQPNKDKKVLKEMESISANINSNIDIGLFNYSPEVLHACNNMLLNRNISEGWFLTKHEVERFKWNSKLEFWFKNKIRFLYRIFVELYRRKLNDKSFGRRSLFQGGRVIAFVGMDGCGKTTTIENMTNLFGKQMNVTNVFMGSGYSGASILRKLIMKVFKSKLSKVNKTTSKKDIQKISIASLIWQYLCIVDRENEYKKMHISSSKGGLVLVDRWLQMEIKSFLDGPRLGDYIESPSLIGRLAKREQRIFEKVLNYPIDAIILLKVSPELSVLRKPLDLTLEEAEVREKMLGELNWNKQTNIISINADQEQAKVLSDVAKSIWASL